MLYYLNDFIAFLVSGIDLTPYKDYFNFLCKILEIYNNEKKKKRDQIEVFLEIVLVSMLIKARFLTDDLKKCKL